jgi:dolichol kinase
MVLAYDFPLLSLFWAMFLFFVMLSIFFAIIWAFVDNFRRRDHSGWAKAGWAFAILIIPLFGMLIYLIARPVDALEPM